MRNWITKPSIYRSWRKNKKFAVKTPKGYIHFGDRRYRDFTDHGDQYRRAAYLKRAAGILDGSGKKTINNPYSANFWSARILWGYKSKL